MARHGICAFALAIHASSANEISSRFGRGPVAGGNMTLEIRGPTANPERRETLPATTERDPKQEIAEPIQVEQKKNIIH